MSQTTRDEIPPGTLDMLILRTLAVPHREMHGFAIAEAIERGSREILQVEEGSLYPALQRLMIKGWLSGEWGRTPENRRARYYKLTPAGRRHLAIEIAAYRRVSLAIDRILDPA